jgi:hypothetical protein
MRRECGFPCLVPSFFGLLLGSFLILICKQENTLCFENFLLGGMWHGLRDVDNEDLDTSLQYNSNSDLNAVLLILLVYSNQISNQLEISLQIGTVKDPNVHNNNH